MLGIYVTKWQCSDHPAALYRKVKCLYIATGFYLCQSQLVRNEGARRQTILVINERGTFIAEICCVEVSDWPAKEAAVAAEVAVGPAVRWWWWWSLCSRDACLLAAAIGQPDKLRWVLRLVLTWPRPLQPGVGHFRIVSCIARTNGHGQQNHPISFDLSITDLYLYKKDLQCI